MRLVNDKRQVTVLLDETDDLLIACAKKRLAITTNSLQFFIEETSGKNLVASHPIH